ncbi:hypothetical protein N0V90_005643 [Kalmusia sp. IMI 367209]|nr:hypothetical protein N0V90_005643 [Kalmusia sp. IMI 367209]
MATFLEAILNCLTGTESMEGTIHNEKAPPKTPRQPLPADKVADKVVLAIANAEKGGPELQRRLDNIIDEYGWTEKVAEWVLTKLEQTLREAEKLKGPLKEAYEKACEAAVAVEGFVKEHPVFVTVVALGVLVIIAPWVLEVLGFGELGPIEVYDQA